MRMNNPPGLTLVQRGLSLIEVLVAVFIFSLGLLGLAGLLVVSSKANHSAYLRTQATFIAGSMADRMRANPVGVWNDSYDVSDIAGVTYATPEACGTSDPCSPDELANHDLAQWKSMLGGLLPNGTASIACAPATSYIPTDQQQRMRPPYSGSCTMLISWDDRGISDEDSRGTDQQTFSWVFQP